MLGVASSILRSRSSIPRPVYKPSSVPAEWWVAIIYLDQPSPTGSPAPRRRGAAGFAESDLPAGLAALGRGYPGQVRPGSPLAALRDRESREADRLLGLAGGGVCPADDVTVAAVRSYRTISPLPEPQRAIGCVFSVALSLGLLPVVIGHHRALGSAGAACCAGEPVSCSDFPLWRPIATQSDRPTNLGIDDRLRTIEDVKERQRLLDFCKMAIGPALGRKNLFLDSSFLSLNHRTSENLHRFFKEIEN